MEYDSKAKTNQPSRAGGMASNEDTPINNGQPIVLGPPPLSVGSEKTRLFEN